MFEAEVSLTFIFSTIAVILVFTAIAVLYINKKAKKVNKNDAL
jgi:ABC-type antimicrobial peptide transport system permease subunit